MASWAPEMPDPNAGDDLAYTEAWENRIPADEQDDDEDACDECGASTDDGEGYDGLCGNCADRAEAAGRWS